MGWFSDFQASAKASLAKFNNATFKNAAMSACALMAAADGNVTPDEVKKIAGLIGSNEMLAVFPPLELKATFETYCAMAVDDFRRIELVNHVRKLAGNAEQAHLAIGIALVIANADGNFDDKEKLVIGELCGVLGVPATQYLS